MGRIGGSGTAVDHTDELAQDNIGNAPLLLAQIVSIVRNWMAVDLGTISRCVGSIVNHLAQHPELQQELREHCIEPDRRVYLDWVTANRDPAVFGDPHDYRPVENAANNLVHGIGKHVCPGRALSTMELRVATVGLLHQTTAIIPARGAQNVRETPPLGGFDSVHVILAKKQLPLEN